MLDSRFYVAYGVGEPERLFRFLLQQVKGDSFGRSHSNAGKSGQFGHEVLDALGVVCHVVFCVWCVVFRVLNRVSPQTPNTKHQTPNTKNETPNTTATKSCPSSEK